MKSQQTTLLCFFLVVFMAAITLFAGDSEKEAVPAAVKAAESWLGLVDEGEYGKSWEQSAELFRAALSKEEWEKSLNSTREPLGELIGRKVKSTKYATSLPGAPDGAYVVIQFTTSFTNKNSAIETITPMKDPDGAWRVSGYYLK